MLLEYYKTILKSAPVNNVMTYGLKNSNFIRLIKWFLVLHDIAWSLLQMYYPALHTAIIQAYASFIQLSQEIAYENATSITNTFKCCRD